MKEFDSKKQIIQTVVFFNLWITWWWHGSQNHRTEMVFTYHQKENWLRTQKAHFFANIWAQTAHFWKYGLDSYNSKIKGNYDKILFFEKICSKSYNITRKNGLWLYESFPHHIWQNQKYYFWQKFEPPKIGFSPLFEGIWLKKTNYSDSCIFQSMNHLMMTW